VMDEPIVDAQRMLARYEGIFAEPTGTAALAGMLELVSEGAISRDETVVVEVTGHGFKDLGQVEGMFDMPRAIMPDMDEVKRRIGFTPS